MRVEIAEPGKCRRAKADGEAKRTGPRAESSFPQPLARLVVPFHLPDFLTISSRSTFNVDRAPLICIVFCAVVRFPLLQL